MTVNSLPIRKNARKARKRQVDQERHIAHGDAAQILDHRRNAVYARRCKGVAQNKHVVVYGRYDGHQDYHDICERVFQARVFAHFTSSPLTFFAEILIWRTLLAVFDRKDIAEKDRAFAAKHQDALQEWRGDERLMDMWKRLGKRYGHKYIYIGGHRDNYPQVVTSRFPLESVARITGNPDTLVSHGAGWVRLQLWRTSTSIS